MVTRDFFLTKKIWNGATRFISLRQLKKKKTMVSLITFLQRKARVIALIGGVSALAAIILYNAIKYGI